MVWQERGLEDPSLWSQFFNESQEFNVIQEGCGGLWEKKSSDLMVQERGQKDRLY